MNIVYGPDLLRRLTSSVVGRPRELESVVAALAAGRHLLIEGPPGTGKSTLLRAVAQQTGAGFEFVEGNAELTPARLIGSFDPAAVLNEGYVSEAFADGPLLRAMRNGSLLYLEEINRIPEETLNVLITVMSESELHVPRIGPVTAAAGFRLVAAMNPFDAVGTARIASAVYDRCCRLAMDYQDASEEIDIVTAASGGAAVTIGAEGVAAAVEMVRDSRSHPEIRTGSSVRGAIDFVLLATPWRHCGMQRHWIAPSPSTLRFWHCRAASGFEGSAHSPEEIVNELWSRRFAKLDPGGSDDAGSDDNADSPSQSGEQESLTPPPGGGRGSEPDDILEGESAAKAVARAGRRTTARRDLMRQPRFSEMSPEVGELDADAFGELLDDSPDEALALLADMAGATDEKLRELARALAGRIAVDIATTGVRRGRGVHRLTHERSTGRG